MLWSFKCLWYWAFLTVKVVVFFNFLLWLYEDTCTWSQGPSVWKQSLPVFLLVRPCHVEGLSSSSCQALTTNFEPQQFRWVYFSARLQKSCKTLGTAQPIGWTDRLLIWGVRYCYPLGYSKRRKAQLNSSLWFVYCKPSHLCNSNIDGAVGAMAGAGVWSPGVIVGKCSRLYTHRAVWGPFFASA